MTFPWDELNILRSRIEAQEIESAEEPGRKQYDPEKCIDIVYEFLEFAWTMGVENTNENLSTSFVPQDAEFRAVAYEKIAGEDFTERVRKHAIQGDFEAIMRVADTESGRLMNTAALTTAKKAGATYKVWQTMNDDRVRDTHDYLFGMMLPIDDLFVTYDGDRALQPGGFTEAYNNVNCRCTLTFA